MLSNFLYKAIAIPLGLGILGWMLFLEKSESLLFRFFGLLVGFVFLPAILLVGGYLILEDLWDQFKHRKREARS